MLVLLGGLPCVLSERSPAICTVGAPAVAAAAVLDGRGPGQLEGGEDGILSRHLGQFHALSIEQRGQRALHGLVGKRRAVARETGPMVEIQNLLPGTATT